MSKPYDPAQTHKPFTYTPLPNPTTHIRLLTIHPAPRHHPLTCTLTTVPLHSISHTCLSYTWGPDSNHESILINNRHLQIRPTLASFLHFARRVGFTTPIWIDAVCINQGDVSEKNAQVGIMGRIYESAGETVVWVGGGDEKGNAWDRWDELGRVERFVLGALDENEIKELKRVDAAGEKAHIGTGQTNSTINPWPTRNHLLTACIRNRMLFRAFTETPLYRRWYESCNTNDLILQFASAGYWRRAWIVQEIVLSRRAVMLCSNGVVEVANLLPLAVMVVRYLRDRQRQEQQQGTSAGPSSLGYDLGQVEADIQFITQRLVMKHIDIGPVAVSLDEALSLTWSRLCSDIKDRVFSILSISTAASKFEVDYDQTTQELLFNLVTFEAERWMSDTADTNNHDMKRLQTHLSMVAWSAGRALQVHPPDESGLCTLEEWLGDHRLGNGGSGQRLFWVRQQSWGADGIGKVPVVSTCFVLRVMGGWRVLECRFDVGSMKVYPSVWWVERDGCWVAEG